MPKPMILLTHFRNINGLISDTTKPTLSYTHRILYSLILLIWFRSDLLLFGHKKSDKEPLIEFLWWGVCCHIRIKDYLPKWASFGEHIWEIVIYIVIIDKKRLSSDIWLKTPNQDTGIDDNIIQKGYKIEAI